VGEYAAALRRRLRAFQRVQLVGELVTLRPARTRVYFELRDAAGAVDCSVWRDDWEGLVARLGPLKDGMQLVVAGGCDYYPGSGTSSPGFSFHVTDLRVAGEGDLLARIDRLRKALDAVREEYDFVLLDCPPSLGLLTVNALTAAKSVLIPISCEYMALRGLKMLLDTVTKKVSTAARIAAFAGVLPSQ